MVGAGLDEPLVEFVSELNCLVSSQARFVGREQDAFALWGAFFDLLDGIVAENLSHFHHLGKGKSLGA